MITRIRPVHSRSAEFTFIFSTSVSDKEYERVLSKLMIIVDQFACEEPCVSLVDLSEMSSCDSVIFDHVKRLVARSVCDE